MTSFMVSWLAHDILVTTLSLKLNFPFFDWTLGDLGQDLDFGLSIF